MVQERGKVPGLMILRLLVATGLGSQRVLSIPHLGRGLCGTAPRVWQMVCLSLGEELGLLALNCCLSSCYSSFLLDCFSFLSHVPSLPYLVTVWVCSSGVQEGRTLGRPRRLKSFSSSQKQGMQKGLCPQMTPQGPAPSQHPGPVTRPLSLGR